MNRNNNPFYKALKFGSSIKNKDVSLHNYAMFMLNRTQQIFKWENLPETLPKIHIERMLQTKGHTTIAEHEGRIYALDGNLGGELNEYYEPTKSIVANPALGLFKEYTINTDCVVVSNDSYKMGLVDIFQRYGSLLVEGDLTIYNMLVLARGSTFITASDNRTLENANNFLRSVENGNLTAIGESAFFEGIKSHSALNQNISQFQQIIELMQYLKASCLNEIGLDANWNMKRQALGANESALNDDFLYPLIHNMLDERLKGIELVNKMFGLDIKVGFDSSWLAADEELNERIELDVYEDEPEPEEDEEDDKEAKK